MMPHDLSLQEKKDESELTASPDSHTGDTKATDGDGYDEFTVHQEDDGPRFGAFRRMPTEGKNLTDIHPYVQSLNITDVDSCTALENATFPEHERCSKEKVNIRLSLHPCSYSTIDIAFPIWSPCSSPAELLRMTCVLSIDH